MELEKATHTGIYGRGRERHTVYIRMEQHEDGWTAYCEGPTERHSVVPVYAASIGPKPTREALIASMKPTVRHVREIIDI